VVSAVGIEPTTIKSRSNSKRCFPTSAYINQQLTPNQARTEAFCRVLKRRTLAHIGPKRTAH